MMGGGGEGSWPHISVAFTFVCGNDHGINCQQRVVWVDVVDPQLPAERQRKISTTTRLLVTFGQNADDILLRGNRRAGQ